VRYVFIDTFRYIIELENYTYFLHFISNTAIYILTIFKPYCIKKSVKGEIRTEKNCFKIHFTTNSYRIPVVTPMSHIIYWPHRSLLMKIQPPSTMPISWTLVDIVDNLIIYIAKYYLTYERYAMTRYMMIVSDELLLFFAKMLYTVSYEIMYEKTATLCILIFNT